MLTGEGAAQEQQEQHHREPFRVGEVVERDIDGVWFPAQVVGVHEKTYEAGRSGSSGSIGRPWQLAYDLVYLDDNNRESEGEGKDGGVHDEGDDGHAGPKVTIHSSRGTFDTKEDGSASAYIINGPETNVAAGSGLRGIRWLRGP
ncbi:conserved unknown protein [Ectocarpus siliculosus]|uniref:Uncharacterized protein n=1 Tax=Ectocarpus siliculosus TaxID=2880 RepID=D8LHB0_ECTSI|nr:conserved unknown protein [Ectocarpus siliculosus]|eukprot:CBN74329.1 conserved unknown protein [Ectocarpus siliculosus]